MATYFMGTRTLTVDGSVFRRHRSHYDRTKSAPKTISRASSRRSQAESAQSKQTERGGSSDSESDHDENKTRNAELDQIAINIADEKAWDTDLEEDDAPPPAFDHSGKNMYLEECKQLGVIPTSYFLRHMSDQKLDMKHHGLAASGMKAIATVMMSNTTVLTLDLSDNWLGYEGGLAVCGMLRENCFITDLNLSDNRLNSCAAELCHIMSHNDTLRRVTLAGNDFDDKSAEYFAEFMTSPCRVEYLDLSHNNLCEGAGLLLGPAISDNASLKELDLSWNHLRRKGAIAVAAGVKTNVCMKKINVSWNGFGHEGSVALGDALKANSVLEELDVMNNRITTEGAVLIGKGLSVNETLKVLRIGKNPLQSAGAWGICAAIVRNPNCVMEELDFSDVLVNSDFEAIFQQVKDQLPGLTARHGGTEPPLKPKARVHPMVKLMTYIDKNNLRLVDFFNKFDKDGSMSVTHDEFRQGLMETGIQLPEEDVDFLLEELDRDGDGEINYSELVIGHTDFQEQEKKMSTVITVLRPMTS
ncbi:leucine-rich repeat-containing protein 74B-like isoform X2 [Littorina saxatilis]|uniref:leucine-rich repeat-containing protein 74B-like isoform X2 n=1 Tax=Littorina saxatilis TaxID=31220 RepID=UPI0038B65063